MRCPFCGRTNVIEVMTRFERGPGNATVQAVRYCDNCGTVFGEEKRHIDAILAERDGYRAVAEQRAQEVERLQGKVDYWRSEFETTRKQRDALAAENRRMLEGHKGDPCIFCGKMHDEVEVGPCPGPAQLKADLGAKTAENARLRGALEEAVGAINSLPFDALGIHPGDDVMSPYSIRDELSWRLQTILTPHDCAGEVGK